MNEFYLVAVVVIGILSVARTARLIVWDEFPPMMLLRAHWDAKVGSAGWGKLIKCQFCITPYLAAGMVLWAWLALDGSSWTDVGSSAWWWTVVNGTWGLSYVAAMVVSYDGAET